MNTSITGLTALATTAFELEDSALFGNTRLQLILVIVAILCFIGGFALRDVIAKRVMRRPGTSKPTLRTERAR